jgi:hypothetical protein
MAERPYYPTVSAELPDRNWLSICERCARDRHDKCIEVGAPPDQTEECTCDCVDFFLVVPAGTWN